MPDLADVAQNARDLEPATLTVFIPITHYIDAFLHQAIDSIRAQSRSDWRLMFVVPESRVAHFQALLSEPLTDPRVRLVGLQGHRLAGAYNTAMRAAETAFVAPLLGDDLWSHDAVAVLAQHIAQHPEVDFFHTGRRFVDANTQPISSAYLPTEPVTVETFVSSSPVKHLMCWRASMGLACGGVDESLQNHASDDYDFPWTMLEHGARFHAIQQPLYVFRDHREGFRLTTHIPRNVQEQALRQILTKHGVPSERIRERLKQGQYLRQSLFRNAIHQWIRERIGFDARRGWRERYR